jgi:hypothetical protein
MVFQAPAMQTIAGSLAGTLPAYPIRIDINE